MDVRLQPQQDARFNAQLVFVDLGRELERQLGAQIRAVSSGSADRPTLAVAVDPPIDQERLVRIGPEEVSFVLRPTGSHAALPHRLSLTGLSRALERRGISVRQAETRASGRGSELALRVRVEYLDHAPQERAPAPAYAGIITIDPRVRSGKACVRGLRITVQDVLEYLASGMSEAEILEDFPDLTREDIRACLAYAADRERRLRGAVV